MFQKIARIGLIGLVILLFENFKTITQTKSELQSRGGLPFFIQKLNSGDSIRIAYLGGSITEAPGWRVYSFDWLQEKYPDNHFVQIPAAIGGTGSDFGAYRLQEQVLSNKPDLVFVEFAVNDNGKPEDKIIQAMEGKDFSEKE